MHHARTCSVSLGCPQLDNGLCRLSVIQEPPRPCDTTLRCELRHDKIAPIHENAAVDGIERLQLCESAVRKDIVVRESGADEYIARETIASDGRQLRVRCFEKCCRRQGLAGQIR